MATPRVLRFDAESRPLDFSVWLLRARRLLESQVQAHETLWAHASGDLPEPAGPAPLAADPTPADSDRHACERADVRTTSEFLTAIKARCATPTTVSLGRLFLPFLFPDLALFERTADLITHLRSLDSSYRAACTDAQLALLPPPMGITIYFIAISLPHRLASVRDALLLKHPSELTIEVLESALKDVESNLRSVASASGVVPPPLFHGCTVPQLPTFTASLATAATDGAGGGGGGGGGDVTSGGGGSAGAGGAPRAAAGDSPAAAGGGDARVLQPPTGLPAAGGGAAGVVPDSTSAATAAAAAAPPLAAATAAAGARCSQPCGRSHPPGQCFAQLADTVRLAYGVDGPAPDWLPLVQTYGPALWGMSACHLVDLFGTPHAMYAVVDSSASDSVYSSVVSLGASLAEVPVASVGNCVDTSPGVAPEDASLSFTLDFGASHCFFRDRTTLTPLPTPPSGETAVCDNGDTYAPLATFTAEPGSGLYTLHTGPRGQQQQQQKQLLPPTPVTVPRQVPASHQVAASPQVGVSGQASRVSLPSLLPSLAPPCGPCVEGRLRATPHSSLRPATEPFETLHLDVWGPASCPGPERERFFLVVVDDYSRYTTMFPLAKKSDVTSTLIRWLLTTADTRGRRVSCLHSDRGGEFRSGILAGFCREQGIRQSWTLPESPQQNGVAERRIGFVMEIARTSMTHARAPHFLWPYAVWYAAHQLNLWPRVSQPEVSPTSLWTGSPGAASRFRVWGCLALVRDTSADKISPRADSCVFLGFPGDSSGYTFYHPPLHRFFDSRDVRFEIPSPTTPGTPVEVSWFLLPLSSLLQLPLVLPRYSLPPLVLHRQPTADPAGAGFRGEDPGGASSRGAGVGAESVHVRGPGSGGAGVGAEPVNAGDSSLWGASVRGAVPGGATTRGAPSAGPGEPGTDLVTSGGAGSGGGATGSLESGPGATTAPDTTPPPHPYPTRHQARQEQPQQQPQQQQPPPPPVSGLRTLGLPSPSPPSPPSPPVSGPPLPPPDPSPDDFPPPLPPLSPPLSHTWPSRRSPRARPSSPVPFTDLRTALFCSFLPRFSPSVLPSPPELALTASLSTPVTDYYRTYRPVLSCVLASLVTGPRASLSSVSALIAAVNEFASTRCLDYATSLVDTPPTSPLAIKGESALGYDALEDMQFELEFLAAASPHLCAMLLALEGDPDALDIPTPRTYAEAVSGPWASQWRAAMDSEMASYRSTGTYVDEVPRLGANVVDGMWIFRVKRPPGSPPVFKARYVARGFSQREGVDFFQTFAPTPKMTSLRVLLHVAAQSDYELHSLDFSIAFLQGSLHKEVWLCRPSAFTCTFPPRTQWRLRRPVYGLCQAPREWHDTLRSTLSDLGFQPSSADPSLFVRRGSTPFFVLVYVDDLVFATTDRVALADVKLEPQKRHTCTDLGELRHYLGLQITRDRAARTITLSQSHMVQQVLQRFELQHSTVQRTPLAVDHRLVSTLLTLFLCDWSCDRTLLG
ncbi:unnamed protein product [Closterium sp. NIES-53]